MLKTACRTVQELFLVVYYQQALLADCVTAVEVARCFLLGVIEVVTHGALHLPHYSKQL